MEKLKQTLVYGSLAFLTFMVMIQAYRTVQLENAMTIQISINEEIVEQFDIIEREYQALKEKK